MKHPENCKCCCCKHSRTPWKGNKMEELNIYKIEEEIDFESVNRLVEEFKELSKGDDYKKNAYTFEKKIVEERGDEIFKRNERGNITGLDYFNFAVTAMKLLSKENENAA